jgi:hypothetical protein
MIANSKSNWKTLLADPGPNGHIVQLYQDDEFFSEAIWLHAEEMALASGYQGLRIAGNVGFLSRESWQSFMPYEDAADKTFRGRRITCICSYPQSDCRATHVFEVAPSNYSVFKGPATL